MRRLLLVCACLLLAGCGGDDVRERAEEVRQQARERVREARQDAGRLRDRVVARVERVLDDLEQAVPQAGPATRPPSVRGREEPGTISAFLTDVLESVDTYWTRTLRAAGRPEPRVSYHWVEPGSQVMTGCRAPADERAALYCPADDTIYIGQTMAAEVYQGLIRGLPGQEAGYGRAVGDFGTAYIVAHEYAHNLQAELGSLAVDARASTKAFELQADCMAGLWGNSVYRAGKLKPGDVDEAISTALAVGDFDYGSENHHGTPPERRDAWVLGFESGDPPACNRFLED